MNKLQMAEQFFKAVQKFALSLSDDEAMEIATLYDPWKAGETYDIGARFTHGENSVGDPQLYKCNQKHTASENYPPGSPGTESLYTPIGLDEEGYPVWSQPTGAHDAYNTGDIVDYKGKLFESLIDGNIWAPDLYPAGWKEVPTEPVNPEEPTEITEPTGQEQEAE